MSWPSRAAPMMWRLVAALLAAGVAVTAADGSDMTHLHLYIHDTTAITLVGDSSFGSVGAFDDELREGPDAASQYLGRAEGVLVQADLGNPAAWCTVLSLVFTEGDYGGSTALVSGRADLGKDEVVELGVVGGTGRFRGARGYSLMTKVENPTPGTVVFEMDLYVI